MISNAEIQMIRNADPGAILPGIDTRTGNAHSTSSLLSYTQITQKSAGAPYYYNPSNNAVFVTQNGAVLSGINFGTATVTIDANNVTIKDSTFTATSVSGQSTKLPAIAGRQSKTTTFQGSGSPTETNVWIDATRDNITIKGQLVSQLADRRRRFQGGVVTGNYFSGAGFGDWSACGRNSVPALPGRRPSLTISSMGPGPTALQLTRTAILY